MGVLLLHVLVLLPQRPVHVDVEGRKCGQAEDPEKGYLKGPHYMDSNLFSPPRAPPHRQHPGVQLKKETEDYLLP